MHTIETCFPVLLTSPTHQLSTPQALAPQARDIDILLTFNKAQTIYLYCIFVSSLITSMLVQVIHAAAVVIYLRCSVSSGVPWTAL